MSGVDIALHAKGAPLPSNAVRIEVQDTKASLKSFSVPLSRYLSDTAAVPGYKAYTTLKRNVVVEGDEDLRYFPYFGDNADDHEIDVLYKDRVREFRKLHQRAEKAARFTFCIKRYLTAVGCSMIDVVQYLLGDLTNLTGRDTSRELAEAVRSRPTMLPQKFDADLKSLMLNFPAPEPDVALAAAKACGAFSKTTGLSVWEVSMKPKEAIESHEEDQAQAGLLTKVKRRNGKIDWGETKTANHGARGPFRPCFHAGPCEKGSCSCANNDVACEKQCFCPSGCEWRFRGCSCAKKSRACQKDKCACWRLNRECDADLCGACGAREALDPRNQGDRAVLEQGCANVSLQLGRPKRTFLGHSQVAGYGLFMGEAVRAGEYLGEYTGEVVSSDEANRRGRIYDKRGLSYLFDLNKAQVIDATRAGNKFRFINNSTLSDNCKPRVLLANGAHRIGMFANRHLEPGDELFFNYGYTREALGFVSIEVGQSGPSGIGAGPSKATLERKRGRPPKAQSTGSTDQTPQVEQRPKTRPRGRKEATASHQPQLDAAKRPSRSSPRGRPAPPTTTAPTKEEPAHDADATEGEDEDEDEAMPDAPSLPPSDTEQDEGQAADPDAGSEDEYVESDSAADNEPEDVPSSPSHSPSPPPSRQGLTDQKRRSSRRFMSDVVRNSQETRRSSESGTRTGTRRRSTRRSEGAAATVPTGPRVARKRMPGNEL
ncbi:MAG: hypothetical protein M1832_000787 [Thelocarpon impressellum]|nr:MAG: hypothetical protein M1832_000787 [Thelocarpon impressellum]